MGQLWTRTDWNDVIDRVNEKISTCRSGSENLPHVDPNHIWKKSDVILVRDKIAELCSDTNFTELKLWTQKIIDELNSALDNCDCNGGGLTCVACDAPTFTMDLPYDGTEGGHELFLTGLQVASSGYIGRSVDITVYDPISETYTNSIGGAIIACNGTLSNVMMGINHTGGKFKFTGKCYSYWCDPRAGQMIRSNCP